MAAVRVAPETEFGPPAGTGGPDDGSGSGNVTAQSNGHLRKLLEKTAAEHGVPLKDLTVLTNDPFRLDTPANHDLAKWLADTASTLGLGERKIHNRGLHYMILGQPKPDGTTYISDKASWELLESASKVARWLSYIPFDQITDQRNSPPVVRIWRKPEPAAYLSPDIEVTIPDPGDIMPKLRVGDFAGTQPYKLVMVGEKSSLDVVLASTATRYETDLYLPTGDISDTMVYQMAKIGAEDGRPMVVVYFADADPSGWNMGVVIARKLQAFKVLHFPDLQFEIHRAGLIPDQVRRFELPSSPLKETEKRAGAWRAAFGIEQTEIDALATLRPELLRQIAREALDPFFDHTLDGRVDEAESAWLASAIEIVNREIDPEWLGRIRAEAEEKLPAMREQIEELNDQLRIDVDDFDLPPFVIPEAEINGDQPKGLLDSRWSFAEQCRRLIASKAYEGGGS